MERNWPVASQPLALLVIFLLSWGVASSLFPGLVYGDSPLMRIIFLVIGAQICGILVSFIGLPGKSGRFSITPKRKFGNFDYPELFKLLFFQGSRKSSVTSLCKFMHCSKVFTLFLSLALDMLGMIGFGGEIWRFVQL